MKYDIDGDGKDEGSITCDLDNILLLKEEKSEIKGKKILIFDDSTSAVDTATEGRIRTALSKLTGVTKIIIAQRITSVIDTDQIIILDDGSIHAVGTHQDLIASDPIYQEIYASQMKGEGYHGGTAVEREKA